MTARREDGLHALSAAGLALGYAQRHFSPTEVTQAVLAHMARWEPHIHATWAADPEGALAQAAASTARWQQGAPLGPLDGVPVTIKENIATRGLPMPLGTAATELRPAAEDAPPTARLREAGAIMLAKTTMPDYGMLSSGLSSFHALSRNPWNVACNPGGSSAGAGAAAAAGYGPLHLGTDIGGSIRLPAAWCGVVGLKPSDGRVPIYPPYTGRAAGPMARTVADAAAAMSVLSRPDWRDATSLPAQSIDWLDLPATPEAATAQVRGLRIGLLLDAGWGLPLNVEIESAVLAAAHLMATAGAQVTPCPGFTTREMADGIDGFWRLRAWLEISALPPDRQAVVLPYIRQWAEGGAGLSAAQAIRAHGQMAVLRDATVAACRGFDFLISPVAPVSAYAADWASPTNDPARAMEHIAYTLPYNMSGQPAMTVPCGHTTAGLPIGLQIIGARHDDLGVLRMARAWELLGPARLPWPQPPASAG
jgi:Asp-tRNA(Asn)/Glu-tRNA(Gln) amidotransferase A subunit family amidase